MGNIKFKTLRDGETIILLCDPGTLSIFKLQDPQFLKSFLNVSPKFLSVAYKLYALVFVSVSILLVTFILSNSWCLFNVDTQLIETLKLALSLWCPY